MQQPSNQINQFGKLYGKSITNKDTIMEEINETLHCDKPPAIEFFYVEPFPKTTWFGVDIAFLLFGHAVISYTYKEKQYAVNITGYEKNFNMVEISDPTDYLFGREHPTPQGGIYNRTFVGLRIENMDEQTIELLHNYYMNLQIQEKKGLTNFSFGLFQS